MGMQKNKQKKWRDEYQLNSLKKFKPCLQDKVEAQAQEDKEIKECSTIAKLPAEEDRKWQTVIPDDILSIISDLLPLSDFINFRGVCRGWRRAPSCRSNITELSKKDQWCILYDFDARDKDMCLFYQRGERRSCSVRLPGLRGAKCFASQHGWLFLRRNDDYLFFNPLTLEEIFLPKYPAKPFGPSACQVGTFLGNPSQHCDVVLLSSRKSPTVHVASCRLTAKNWAVVRLKFDASAVACDSVLLPSPRAVQFVAVRKDSRRANRINFIRILYDKHFLLFDFEDSVHLIQKGIKRFKVLHDRFFHLSNWYAGLEKQHSDDWICKFGAEFAFSFCLFNDCKLFSDHVFGGYCAAIPNVPIIKAAWLKTS